MQLTATTGTALDARHERSAATIARGGLEIYFDALRTAFEQACMAQPRQSQFVRVGRARIQLDFAGTALLPAVAPALAHLGADSVTNADIVFELWDRASTGIRPPRPPFNVDDYRRYGQRAIAYAAPFALMHAPNAGLLFAYDRATRHGYFWTDDAAQLSIYERAAPVQTLFHWALADFGWQVVHAAAVGTARGGVLLVGNTGAGKSTTALSCLAQDGIKFLSDDKCLVRLEPEPTAFAIFSSGKIKADMLEHMPQFRSQLVGWDDYFKARKGLVYLYPAYAEHMIQSFPIKALVLPAVTNGPDASIQSASAISAFRQIGPSTVIWLPGAEADNYHFTAELTRRLPCYRLNLAVQPERNQQAIAELLARL